MEQHALKDTFSVGSKKTYTDSSGPFKSRACVNQTKIKLRQEKELYIMQ